MTRARLFLGALMAMMCTAASAQDDEREMEWLNVTVLHYAATGHADRNNKRELIPMKYRGVWSDYDDTIKMTRQDGDLDVYDANMKLIDKEPAPK